MMAIYNPDWTNVTSIYQLVKTADDLSDHILVTGFLIALFFVILLSLHKYEFKNALLVTSWVVFLISLFGWYAEFVGIYVLITFLSLAGISVFLKVVMRDK